jgi:xylulokinase
VALCRRECPCQYHEDGRVEQSSECLARETAAALRQALEQSGADPGRVAALALATQRATVVLTDGEGQALAPALSWQDLRAEAEIGALRAQIGDARYYDLTGLPLNPVFSLGKLLLLQQRQPELFASAACLGLVHDYLLRRLGCEEACLDWSNASLTGLLDLQRRRWSRELLELTGIPEGKLPRLVAPGEQVGRLSAEAAEACGLREGTPLVAGGGDHQCAGLGGGAVEPGIVEITLGTSGVSLCYTDRVVKDPERRITCCAHAVPGAWELEGLQNSAGASLQWLAELVADHELGDEDYQAVAEMGPGAQGLLFYPFLAGSSAPAWIPHASGLFLGLTHAHRRAALLRAVMEGVSLETRGVLEVFASLGLPIAEVRLTGGYSNVAGWNQMQADIYGKSVRTLENQQASLLGAAILGACGVGAFPSVPAGVAAMVRVGETYAPDPAKAARYDQVYDKYRAVLQALVGCDLFTRLAR